MTEILALMASLAIGMTVIGFTAVWFAARAERKRGRR